jgi:hypothetical protein
MKRRVEMVYRLKKKSEERNVKRELAKVAR